jgi:6,7-dimethyl-8-ribityllumazine synthase
MAENQEYTKIDGALSAAGLRFAIVISRFNSFITERLLQGAVDALERGGAGSKDIDVVHVPGSFELPLTAKKLATSGKYHALIAIGCIIRGETAHYDYVCSETARGLQLAQMDTGIPILFCVLTCDTLEQAVDRAGLKGGNKGFEAGLGAIEMAQLSRKLRSAATAGRKRAKAGEPDMSLRTKSREFAMQMLFQWEMSQKEPAKLEARFWKDAKAANQTRTFANQLFEGAVHDSTALDELISKHAANWRLERLSVIDRAILRLALHELRATDTPPKVVINEAVELAKKYSSEEAGGFVNGILDTCRKSFKEK